MLALLIISLALIALIVICYWKFIESQRFESTQRKTGKMHVSELEDFGCKDNFTFLLHFVYVFACMFGLLRLAKTAETFALSLKHKRLNDKDSARLNELEQRIKALEQESVELKQKLGGHKLGGHSDLLSAQQNIFISNRFFQLDNGQNGYGFNGGQAFRKVWQKYFELQKQTPQLLDSHATAAAVNDKFALHSKLPFTKIVSTEELQAMHGFQ